MENAGSKADPNTGNNCPNIEGNPNNNNPSDAGTNRRRTPFTNLSQVDADLALARTLQEQERAYMMLREGRGGSGYGSWEVGGYEVEEDGYEDVSEQDYDGSDLEEDDDEVDGEEEEDAFDANAHEEEVDGSENVELDPSAYSSDEAYARALQDAEDREMATRMLALAGMNEVIFVDDDEEEEEEDEEEHGGNSQEAWEEVDPDELSYEELIALGEVVGTQSRGLSADTIASLPSTNYKCQGTSEGIHDSCVVCRLDYEEDDTLTVLSCKHSYHSECINNWLQINKVCPVCSAEVTSVKS